MAAKKTSKRGYKTARNTGSELRSSRLVRPLRVRVTRAEYDELKRRKPTKIEDYEEIFGASDVRCAQIMSAAHHDIPMEAIVA